MKMPLAKKYSGFLKDGQKYQHNKGATATVDNILKEDGVWMVYLHYLTPKYLGYSSFKNTCYDFEKEVGRVWHRI